MDGLLTRVRARAAGRCEYCRMPQAYYPTVPFPIDHVIARQHGGPTAFNNLAVSCLHCNSHKGPNIAGLDPKTRKLTRLFNPRGTSGPGTSGGAARTSSAGPPWEGPPSRSWR